MACLSTAIVIRALRRAFDRKVAVSDDRGQMDRRGCGGARCHCGLAGQWSPDHRQFFEEGFKPLLGQCRDATGAWVSRAL